MAVGARLPSRFQAANALLEVTVRAMPREQADLATALRTWALEWLDAEKSSVVGVLVRSVPYRSCVSAGVSLTE